MLRSSCSPAPWVSLALLLAAATTSAAAQAPAKKPQEFPPGVLTTVLPEILPDDVAGPHDMVEIRSQADLTWTPKLAASTRTLHERSALVQFARPVWGLEFSFKPLRMVAVDVPQANGATTRRLVWYMVYRVRNLGIRKSGSTAADGEFSLVDAPQGPVRFIPRLVLESLDSGEDGKRDYKAYLDRVIPAAVEPIRQREVPDRVLLTSVEMAEQELPVVDETSDGVWGVAMWEDPDPAIDFLSVVVTGLTNAYAWVDPPGAYQGGGVGQGRQLVPKSLQLNFWRPGDEYLENEAEIRFGAAPGRADLYGVGEGVAQRWVFR